MRPRTSATAASACSWVIFSFLTSRACWAVVTSRAFSRPTSTNFWSTSLSRTGMPAAPIACAISPPMVPAPTTAALKTNMSLSLFVQLAVGLDLDGQLAQRAAQRLAQLAADEEQVDEPHRVLQLVLQLQRDAPGREAHALGARQLGVLDLDVLALARAEPAHL